MAEFTLLEVHLDDASLSVNAPFVGETETSEEDEEGGSEGGSGFPVVPVFALVVVALAAAVAARKGLGDDESDIDIE